MRSFCKELLQRILPDLRIDRIEYPETQKGIRPDSDAKSVRLDVYVQDGKDTVYDIEMQVTDKKNCLKEAAIIRACWICRCWTGDSPIRS